MPRPHPVHPIFIGRDLGPGGFELVSKAYRPVAYRNQWRGPIAHAARKARRRAHEWLPDLLGAGVKRCEHLASLRIGDCKDRCRAIGRSQGAEGRDAAQPEAARLGQSARRRDADSKPGERARTDADRDPAHGIPAARLREDLLDGREQLTRVAGPPRRIGLEKALAQDVRPSGERNAQMRRGGVETKYVIHALERTVKRADKTGDEWSHPSY